MRILIKLVVSAALLFGGYWAVGAFALGRALPAMFARSDALAGRAGPVAGFPTAFRSDLRDLQIRDAGGVVLWQMDPVNLTLPSAQPGRATLVLPQAQSLIVGGTESRVLARDMVAQLQLRLDRTLQAASLTSGPVEIDPALVMTGLDRLDLQIDRTAPAQYAVTAEMRDLALAPLAMFGLDPEGQLPDRIQALRFRADLNLAEPIGRGAPDPRLIRLEELAVDWGPLGFALTGTLARSAVGLLDGDLELILEDWRPLQQLLVANGTLTADIAMLAGMYLAGLSPDGSPRVSVPLMLQRSVVRLGPFVLLELPPL
ncbi:MAG: DUF2125 domain-containing protein [Roseinatronobacter sp.]